MRRTGLLLVLAAAACAQTAPAPRQSEAMERSARLLERLDRLEADLHSGEAEMATYSELVRRRSRTEQIACQVTDEHMEDVGRLAAIQEERMARQAGLPVKKRKAVAAARARSPRPVVRVVPASG